MPTSPCPPPWYAHDASSRLSFVIPRTTPTLRTRMRSLSSVTHVHCRSLPPFDQIQINCLQDMGLTAQDVVDLNDGWRLTTAAAMEAVSAAGGWVWQMFEGGRVIENGATGARCPEALRNTCTATSPQQTRMCYTPVTLAEPHTPGSLVDPTSDVARFLLTRGSYGYLGTGWVGCAPSGGEEGHHTNQTYVRPREFDVDYGSPVGLCAETATDSGVFTREWTKATVAHDCNTGKSTLTMK